MIARFEDTRDLRLMGGYRDGTDPDLDRAVELVPSLYDALRQGPSDPPSADAFQEVARAFAPAPAGDAQPRAAWTRTGQDPCLQRRV